MATPESPAPRQPETDPEQNPFEYLWRSPGHLIQSISLKDGFRNTEILTGENCEIRITKTAVQDNEELKIAIVPEGKKEPYETYLCDKTGVTEVIWITRPEGPFVPFLTPPLPTRSDGRTLQFHLAVKVAQFVQQQIGASKD